MFAGRMMIAVLCAMPVMAVVSQGAENGWLTLREDGRVVWQMERAPAKDAGARRTVNLKRIFKGGWEERAYSIDTLELDCDAKRYRFTAMVIFDADGDVFHRYRLTDQPAPAPPGSVIEEALQHTCLPNPAE